MLFSCPEQIGGFNNIGVYILAESSGWPIVLTDFNSSDVILAPSGDLIDGLLIPESIKVEEPSKKTADGVIYDNTLSFEFASQSPALDQLLERYKSFGVVAVVCKNYAQKKLYGSDRFPLSLDFEVIHGRRPEDGSLTRVTISGKTPFRSLHILE
jgi:hypothetical protein